MTDFVFKLKKAVRNVLFTNAQAAMSNQLGFVYESPKGATLKLKGVGDFTVTPSQVEDLKLVVTAAGGSYDSVKVSSSNPSNYEFGDKIIPIVLLDVSDEKCLSVKGQMKMVLDSKSKATMSPQGVH